MASKALIAAIALSAYVSAGPVAINVNKNSIGKRDTPLTPGGKKAGSAGGNAVPFWSEHLGWWYDWTPNPQKDNAPYGVPMLWGDGDASDLDHQRFEDFQNIQDTPTYLLGFNEPDCDPPYSSHIDVDKAAEVWNQYIKPWGDKGSLLGSPSMCKQADEDFLGDFFAKIPDSKMDFVAIHVYKKDMDGVRKDLDHYWNAYQKPLWVTEMACVDDQNQFTACTDQGEINQWINDVVDLFEKDDRVYAYAYTDGGGLSDEWAPTVDGASALSESGQTYLSAISRYG